MHPILLGGKPATTPKKKPLEAPTAALAQAISAEEQLTKGKIPPLRSLAYTALDIVATDRNKIIETLLAYVDTDTLCYRAENPELAAKQTQLLDPIIEWLDRRFDIHIEVTDGLLPIEQSAEINKRLRSFFESIDDFRLSAALSLTLSSSSVFLTLAALEGEVDALQFAEAARMEEDFQLERYGADEEAEKRRDTVVSDIAAAMDFLDLLKTA